jgi:hypothetical protein
VYAEHQQAAGDLLMMQWFQFGMQSEERLDEINATSSVPDFPDALSSLHELLAYENDLLHQVDHFAPRC